MRAARQPVRLTLTNRVLALPVDGHCPVCLQRQVLVHLVRAGSEETAICRGCLLAAQYYCRFGAGRPLLFETDETP